MKLYQYLFEKNYNQINFKFENSSLYSLLEWVVAISSLSTIGYMLYSFFLTGNLYYLFGLPGSGIIHFVILMIVYNFRPDNKQYERVRAEVTQEMWDSPQKLKEFIKECVQKAEAGELSEKFKEHSSYTNLIIHQGKDKHVFAKELHNILENYIIEMGPIIKGVEEKVRFEEYLKNEELGIQSKVKTTETVVGTSIENNIETIEVANQDKLNKTALAGFGPGKYLYHK